MSGGPGDLKMSANLRRRQSREYPPDLSDLMNKTKEHAASFIREFNSRELRMRQIAGEFREIAAGVRKIQKTTDDVRRLGAGGLGARAFSMPFGLLTGGAAVGAGAAKAAALAVGVVATALAAGGARALAARALAAARAAVISTATIGAVTAAGSAILVAGANVRKGLSESGSVNKVKQLWKEFMKIAEPLKDDLEEIKWNYERLMQRSADLQAGQTLRDIRQFQRIVREVTELGSSDGVLSAMWNVLRYTATPEEDRKLTDAIIQSADRCQEVVDDLEKMKEELRLL